MAVLFDSSANIWNASVAATGSLSTTHVVNGLANNLVAVVGALWFGGSDTTGGSMSATFGGVSMTPSTALRWRSNVEMGQIFTLANPAVGSQTVRVSTSAMGGTGLLAIVSATYSGVRGIGDIVTQAGSTSTSNSITVGSVSAAYRVVTIHCFGSVPGTNSGFNSYNLVQRASASPYSWPYQFGQILLGDAPGAATVTGTAVQNISSDLWAAFGIPLTPATVLGDSSLSISISDGGSGHIYRTGLPSPSRTWVIES